LERYRFATIEEFNLASSGYWRNWERNTAWTMREIGFSMIAGNPDIKQIDKPTREQILKLSTDEKPEVIKAKKISKKELEEMKQRLTKL